MPELNRIYCGDCLELIKKVDSHSIDAVITDPPYFSRELPIKCRKGLTATLPL